MNTELLILLPDTIYVNRIIPGQGLVTFHEEYNIYYQNILFPFRPEWDIVVNAKYGKNFGDRFTLNDLSCGEDSFPFELIVYDEYGRRLGSKKAAIIAVPHKLRHAPTDVLFVGDSMTQSERYMQHVVTKLYNIHTLGTRSFNGLLRHEGRGGWSYPNYFTNAKESPFLFPEDVPGELYGGSAEFQRSLDDPKVGGYFTLGYLPRPFTEGEYFTEGGKLYRMEHGEKVYVRDDPKLVFDFGKYKKRQGIEKLDVVSTLMGANDIQCNNYEGTNGIPASDEAVDRFIANTHRFVDAVRAADRDVKIIVNLPVLGAGQHSWGKKLNCGATSKAYRCNILHAAARLIEDFDNKQSEGIYLSPMLLTLDPENGFEHETAKCNLYSDALETVQSNWVHPNPSGYQQMGDALAAVIEYVR